MNARKISKIIFVCDCLFCVRDNRNPKMPSNEKRFLIGATVVVMAVGCIALLAACRSIFSQALSGKDDKSDIPQEASSSGKQSVSPPIDPITDVKAVNRNPITLDRERSVLVPSRGKDKKSVKPDMLAPSVSEPRRPSKGAITKDLTEESKSSVIVEAPVEISGLHTEDMEIASSKEVGPDLADLSQEMKAYDDTVPSQDTFEKLLQSVKSYKEQIDKLEKEEEKEKEKEKYNILYAEDKIKCKIEAVVKELDGKGAKYKKYVYTVEARDLIESSEEIAKSLVIQHSIFKKYRGCVNVYNIDYNLNLSEYIETVESAKKFDHFFKKYTMENWNLVRIWDILTKCLNNFLSKEQLEQKIRLMKIQDLNKYMCLNSGCLLDPDAKISPEGTIQSFWIKSEAYQDQETLIIDFLKMIGIENSKVDAKVKEKVEKVLLDCMKEKVEKVLLDCMKEKVLDTETLRETEISYGLEKYKLETNADVIMCVLEIKNIIDGSFRLRERTV